MAYSPVLIIALVGIFYVTTIRSGHRWGDDFSMYILHARNIVSGMDYQDTGYLYDPFLSVIGPRAYPPIFPLILAPIYALYGMNLTAMKVVVIVFFILFLVVFYFSFRKDFSLLMMSAALATLGFNPVFWDIKDDVLSDIPFLFFTYLTLFVIQQNYSTERSRTFTILQVVFAGVLSYLAFGTRSAGIVLIPALFLVDFFYRRRITSFPWIAAVIFITGWFIQNRLIPGQENYLEQFKFLPQTVYFNLLNYSNSLFYFWNNGYSQILQGCLFAILLGLAVIGLILRIRTGVIIYEPYAALYLILILIWPANQGVRFLLPVIPLFVLYDFTAIQWIGQLNFTGSRAVGRWVFACITILAAISYLGAYTKVGFDTIHGGVEKGESRQLFDYIRQSTAPEAVLFFSKPRALALYTDRSASGYSELVNEQFNLNFAISKGVDYFIIGPDDEYLRLLVKRYPDRFELVYTNPDFSMYQFLIP